MDNMTQMPDSAGFFTKHKVLLTGVGIGFVGGIVVDRFAIWTARKVQERRDRKEAERVAIETAAVAAAAQSAA